jgi:hypothetical protein
LREVEEIPVEVVLQHYYEHHYEELSTAEFQGELSELAKTVAERQAARNKADAMAVDDWRFDRSAEAEAERDAKRDTEEAQTAMRAKMAAERAQVEAEAREWPQDKISVSFETPGGFEVV